MTIDHYNDVCPDCKGKNLEVYEDDRTYSEVCLDCGRKCLHDTESMSLEEVNNARKEKGLPEIEELKEV